MTYESWRISYQSSEQAARAAYAKVEELAARLAELEGQEPVAWYADIEGWGREYNGLPELSNGVIGKPLYARPVPAAQPVNARLLEALKQARLAVINNAFPIGWSVDRLSEVIADAESQAGPVRLTEADALPEMTRVDRS